MKVLEHPYNELDGGQWLKGNLHAHSNHSDGARTHQQVIDDYAGRGYDFLMFADHDCLTDHERYDRLDDRGMVLIPGNEITAGGPHMLHVNADRLVRPIRQRQAVIDNIGDGDSFIIINHPNQGSSFDHCPASLLRQLRGYRGIEIYNGMCGSDRGSPYALGKWDMVLAEGRKVWGFASDDSHTAADVGLGWIMVYAYERTIAGVLSALKAGRFYASTGVTLKNIHVRGLHVHIETRNAARIVAIATGGKRIGVADGPAMSVDVPPHVKYLRFECWGTGEQFAWTQPFFVRNVAG